MSQEAIEILRQQRAYQVELNPSSEEFSYSGGTFRGTFDDSHIEENKDAGHVSQKKRSPRIMVAEIPIGLDPRTTIITREDGVTAHTFKYAGKDSEGIPILWLY